MAYTFKPAYPTTQHERSAQTVVDYFARQPGISAVLLTCSCARGKAAPNSCLDLTILLSPTIGPDCRREIETAWESYSQVEPVFAAQRKLGAFSQVDLSFHTGQLDPTRYDHGWTSGADEFELEVGNLLAYSYPLWQADTYYSELRARWLPYYGEDMRQERLAMVLHYCRNNLAHIPIFVQRGLVFQSFKRLYHAFEEFLQALFIARRTYPIAYDKWIHEQIVEILSLPLLYPRLVRLLEVQRLESDELTEKARELESWIVEFVE